MKNEIDLSRADLNLLVLFEVVLQESHLGRAAQQLNLSPSAVSHGIGRLRRLLNDPLFLRTPKGVVPSARARELAEPISDILARVRSVVSTSEPFDPARSTRRFTIGAPDGVSAVFLPWLLADLRRLAPRVDIGIRQVPLPRRGRASQQAWEAVLEDLEARTIDIAVIPVDEVPARFVEQALYEEDFVIAMRAGHPFAATPTLDHYCAMQHLVVSLSGDPHGIFDEILAQQGRSRRVALTVPSFIQALAAIAQTDLIAALPRNLVAAHAARFGLISVEGPFPPRRDRIRAVMTKAASMDAGVAWLFRVLQGMQQVPQTSGRARPGTRTRGRKPPSKAGPEDGLHDRLDDV
jgi:DNA-binding transcriptional LysR family regulator